MKRCKCEHWETCQVCYPQGFDENGGLKPSGLIDGLAVRPIKARFLRTET